MARVTVEDCLGKVPNRFALVLLAAKRARQVYKGASFTEAIRPENKEIVNVLREIAEDRVYHQVDESGARLEQQIENNLLANT